ncbi:MAG: alpha-ketoacid dehydrogenase subunit beta [Nitrospinota bacterium]|nr:alpha-ketoacid dehydrogenase subunit beta [Nitrospinota bacterium]
MTGNKVNYGSAIREGFAYLLKNYPEVFILGQGLWSPWYVGNSMTGLEKEFGEEKIIDTPVSELACTGAAIGASLCGYRPVVVHPRMDFMILAADQIVNQAAKWRHMLGGQSSPSVTIRAIINRGGEQGAQHSQALHSWFAHIPGLRVVMPTTVQDARDLLIASVLCDDPVMYIDDRWLYDLEDDLPEPKELVLADVYPQILKDGKDVTIVAAGYSVRMALEAAAELEQKGVAAEVIDLRVINPLDETVMVNSVKKTGRLLAVDGGWQTCGLAGEIIACIMEKIDVSKMKSSPGRITLPHAPAPTSKPLEEIYYPKASAITDMAMKQVQRRI